MADILVIDDEDNLAYSIQLALKRAGHQCRIASTAEQGLAEAQRAIPDVALIDIQLPDASGLDLIERFQANGIDVPVIVITAFGTVASAVAAMQRGAVDYIQKPLSMDEVALAVRRCLENRTIRNQLDAYRDAQHRQSEESHVIGDAPQMRRVLEMADRIAAIDPTGGDELPAVLLLGETGAGKEVIARYIHGRSSTADRPFVQINCTAIPEHLVESELFGNEPGAFTGAKSVKKGLLEMAHEGTLFLDEIGDMPLTAQAKLLVAIERGRFRRLGSTVERVARARIIAATNGDLREKIARGDFRADLYYRLKVFTIDLPPLRERADDLFKLAEHFIDRYCRKFHRPPLRLPPQTRKAMSAYHWPGNVRELANLIQRAAVICDREEIQPTDLGLEPGAAQHAVGSNGSIEFDFASADCSLETIEKKLINSALRAAGGNTSEAARMLGISRGGLRHRLTKLGIIADGD